MKWVRWSQWDDGGMIGFVQMPVQDVQEAHQRVLALDKMGVTPFAQPYRDYDGGEPTQEQKDFARWVNNKATFRSCRWEDFRPRKGVTMP